MRSVGDTTLSTPLGGFSLLMELENPRFVAQPTSLNPPPISADRYISLMGLSLASAKYRFLSLSLHFQYPQFELENHRSVSKLIIQGLKTVKIFLNVSIKVYGEQPSLLLSQDRVLKRMRQLVAFYFYSQYFYHPDAPIHIQAYHNLIWNTTYPTSIINQ
ncbi:hypothetical protein BGZ63DRAFT_24200 [Mariannaea sp. PMI_226]|nr:hypothetical protein BGZ63DRAFT_24200 [Mariannaea sp. PMI_226]